MSEAMNEAIGETNRRREIQKAHNEKYNITPMTIKKDVRDSIRIKAESSDDGSDAKKLSEMDKAEKRTM
ncbi:hypothetical protein, partial [Methanocalculus natronophilus]|uniref:hypothetical protein n=1 Tax=Methanocalculus natronophilus TaxID=1262400 RepID=UPI003CCC6541